MRRSLVALASAAALVAGLAAVVPPSASAAEPLATIRYTAYGIPHIVADTYYGAGYGDGWVQAEANICVLADTNVTVRGERSRYFGPDGSWVQGGNGARSNNLNSDIFYTRINQTGVIEQLLSGPMAPPPDMADVISGYVAGYNAWLAANGDSITDPACAGAEWVKPMEPIDAYRRFYQLILLASQGVAIDGIASAAPPHPGAPVPALPDAEAARVLTSRWNELADLGSNAYAIGAAGSDDGTHGRLLGNPHFPWDGSERFFEHHITVPGEGLDVNGMTLLGVPAVLIGNTAGVAWSHTVSTAFRFTPFQLTLVPGSPTTYLVDGEPREMTTDTVTVTVKEADGSLGTRTRTLYNTEYGPILVSILGQPIFPWTPTTAFAMGDANVDNFRALSHFFEINHAQSTDEVLDILEDHVGIPWVNTLAADDAGKALYADISVVPHVTDDHADRCNTALGHATTAALRLPVLDGSRSECNWGSDADAPRPGIFGPSNLPRLFRADYVTNSNDSYWLSNPHEPLTGFASIIGTEGTERSLRTRIGLIQVEEQLAAGGFGLGDVTDAVFSNRQYAAELTLDDLVALCDSLPGGLAPRSQAAPVDATAACDALRGFDGRDDLDSTGAVLFRRFWTIARSATGGPWLVPFDAADPVNTPNTLNIHHPQVRTALGDAIADLQGAGIPMDGTLRDWQWEERNGVRIPIHGGPGVLGVFNAINATWQSGVGYSNIPHGSSFVTAVAFDGTPCPDVNSILTYSQSSDPTSPHHSDQTWLYVDKVWVDVPFCEADVLAETLHVTTLYAS